MEVVITNQLQAVALVQPGTTRTLLVETRQSISVSLCDTLEYSK